MYLTVSTVYNEWYLLLIFKFLSLALVDNETLIIGSVDQIQMLHIDMIPLGESPRLVLLISFSNNESYFSQQ